MHYASKCGAKIRINFEKQDFLATFFESEVALGLYSAGGEGYNKFLFTLHYRILG